MCWRRTSSPSAAYLRLYVRVFADLLAGDLASVTDAPDTEDLPQREGGIAGDAIAASLVIVANEASRDHEVLRQVVRRQRT